MAVALHHIVVDTHDLPRLARFWAAVLDWQILSEREREIVVGPDRDAPIGLCFMPVADEKTVKNRLHLDVRLDPGEDPDEVGAAVAARGGQRFDPGWGELPWRSYTDPSGNELCVLPAPSSRSIAAERRARPRRKTSSLRPA